MIRFGILGCGMIANVHADAIKNIQDATLVGVADCSLELARAFASRHCVKAYATYREMLDDSDIDVICVCTPSAFHAENAKEALRAKKHVVVEKPMAFSTKDIDDVIRVSEETGKLVTVICQLRFCADIERVKKLVQANAFGKITLCSLYMKYYRSHEYYASSSWKGTLRFDGGGALMNQGIHGIDLLEYLIGDVKEVQGKIRTLSHQIEVEDTAVAMLEFKNGALGVIEASTCAYPGFERRLEIHGDKGYVVLVENRIAKLMIDGKEEAVADFEVSKTSSDPAALRSAMHQLQIENLICAMKGEERLLIDGKESKRAVRVIEEIYRSSKREDMR